MKSIIELQDKSSIHLSIYNNKLRIYNYSDDEVIYLTANEIDEFIKKLNEFKEVVVKNI